MDSSRQNHLLQNHTQNFLVKFLIVLVKQGGCLLEILCSLNSARHLDSCRSWFLLLNWLRKPVAWVDTHAKRGGEAQDPTSALRPHRYLPWWDAEMDLYTLFPIWRRAFMPKNCHVFLSSLWRKALKICQLIWQVVHRKAMLDNTSVPTESCCLSLLSQISAGSQDLEVHPIQYPVHLAGPYQVWRDAKLLSSPETFYACH